MKIAILGARGIPARYSGYDTLAEELAVRLVEKGHRVRVYCRRSYFKDRPKAYRGVELVYLPAPRGKGIESLLHSLLSAVHALFRRGELIYFLDPANAPFVALLRFFGKRVVVHTDGLGWKRRKWGPLARRYYKWVEGVCGRLASALVADNPVMAEYYQATYGRACAQIAYGAACGPPADSGAPARFGLEWKRYLLVVARLEPENNTDLIVEEYRRSGVALPLAVVGDAPYGAAYLEELKRLGGEHVRFLGRVDDQAALNGLFAGAYLHLHGHEVGGTNPSLLRAMAAGTAPLALDAPFNQAVLGGTGFLFKKEPGDLAGRLGRLCASPETVESAGRAARERAEREYTWEAVTAAHAALFAGLAGPKEPRGDP